MKNILLLSDTHSYMDNAIIKHIHWADQVWHAGDIGDLEVTEKIKALKPLQCVYGNIDGIQARQEFKKNLFFEVENLKILITHIGGAPGRYKPEVNQLIETLKPNLFICGHSHILKVMPDQKNNLLFLNPGAIGKHGFHKVRTMLRFQLDNGNIKNLEVVEFSR